MDLTPILLVGAAFMAYGLVAQRLQRTVLTGPLLFAAFGLLVGSQGLGLVQFPMEHGFLHTLAEVTLVLVLFADAASIDLRQLRHDFRLPVRLLVIGLPLCIALNTLVALGVLPDLAIWEAALLATILAPTDAALGQAVVTSPRVPARIRQALSVESGLNDGVALPLVLVFASVASAMAGMAGGRSAAEWLQFGALQVILGPLVGALVGFVGAWLVNLASEREWTNEMAEGMIALSLALIAFAAAEAVHGNGFIAAFVSGMAMAHTLTHPCKFLYEFAESHGQLLTLFTFMVFGGAMIPEALPHIDARLVLFGLLILTVARMLPVRIALIGAGVRPVTHLFLGWFGPRGLASILFVLLILEEAEVPHADLIFAAAVTTVILSIVLHGITAAPGSAWYGRHAESMGACEENRPVASPAARAVEP